MKTDLSIIGEYALLGLNVILVIALLIIIFNLRKLIKGHIVEANKDLLDHSEKNNAHSMNDILRYEKNISDLKWQIESITFDFDVYRSMHDDFPFPYWLKNKDGIMLWVSKRYEEIFLEPLGLCAEDYIGNKDEKIWGKEIGEVFSRNDHHVINTGKYIRAD